MIGLSFTIAADPRQRRHFQVRVPGDSWPYFTDSDSRVPQPGGSGVHIYIPQEQGCPVIPPGTGFPFRRLLRFAGLRWRFSNPPPHGVRIRVTLRSSLYTYNIGSTPRENTVSQQFLYCYRGVFIPPLHRNGSSSSVSCVLISAGISLMSRCLAMNYSGFQAHVTICCTKLGEEIFCIVGVGGWLFGYLGNQIFILVGTKVCSKLPTAVFESTGS
jgi:hypothetical protein